MKLRIFTDGGSRGNPGDAGIGGVVYNEAHEVVFEFSKYIGLATNNEAEYEAVKTALDWVQKYLQEHQAQAPVTPQTPITPLITNPTTTSIVTPAPTITPITQIDFFLDSKLVVEQMNKNWKIKEPRMQVLAQSCWKKIAELHIPVSFTHVLREKNKEADLLVNQALDAHFSN